MVCTRHNVGKGGEGAVERPLANEHEQPELDAKIMNLKAAGQDNSLVGDRSAVRQRVWKHAADECRQLRDGTFIGGQKTAVHRAKVIRRPQQFMSVESHDPTR